MAVKNFVIRQNWVGRKVPGMKKAFIAIFDTFWTHVLAPKGSNKEFLRGHLVKKDRNYIIINFVTD